MRTFPAVAPSVREARRFVAQTLSEAPVEALNDILVMVSELATNVVQHAVTNFSLAVHHTQGEVCVEVSDFGRGSPQLQPPADAASHGRGLQIVNLLATQWGVRDETDAGKTVWFTLALPGPGSFGAVLPPAVAVSGATGRL